MTYRSIDEIFEAFKTLKVLIVGDVMLDSYIYGSVKRISPEAPVPVVNVQRQENRLGGAGNVALNVQALGATPLLCSVTGSDPEADLVTSLLHQQGISAAGIIKSPDRITTVKNRIISASQHLLRIDSEMDALLRQQDQEMLAQRTFELLEGADLVIFEDYDKGCLHPDFISTLIREANKRGIPTAVDPKKRNFRSYNGCTLFKPNLKELREGLGRDIDPLQQEALTVAIHELSAHLAFKHAIVTLSDKGIYFQNAQTSGLHQAHLRSVADVSGAGDTVISIAGLCLALGMPIAFMAELANLGGGIVCEYQGVLPIDEERLKKEAVNNRILAEQLG